MTSIPHEEKGSGEKEDGRKRLMDVWFAFFLSSGKRNVGKMREAKYICFACGFMDVMVCLCLVIYALYCVFADMVELCYETAWVLS